MYTVLKRNGKVIDFDLAKITQAITLAFDAQQRDYNPSMIDFLALKVTADFEPKIKDHHIAVEDIQDSVENVLVQAGYGDVAKAYILYRRQHEKLREINTTLLDYKEIIEEWATDDGVNVHLTIDNPQEGWDGHVGFVPNYVKELGFDTNKVAVLCGPPIMIKFTLDGLCSIGFDKTNVYTTLELRMKCGVGKCGRCNVGAKYVCKDGPVFRCDELEELPSEY